MSKNMPNWICTAEGPQNNGRLKECGFSFYFDPHEVTNPHCPQCGTKMRWLTQGRSVADLLAAGLAAEKNK